MLRTTRLIFVATLALGIMVPGRAAQAQAAPSVALIGFTAARLTPPVPAQDSVAVRLSTLLAAALGENASVHVVDRAQVQRVVDVQHLPAGRALDREAAVRVGSAVGARHVVYGSVQMDAAGNVRVDVRAANVASGVVEYTDRFQDTAGNPTRLAGQIAARLAAAILGAP